MVVELTFCDGKFKVQWDGASNQTPQFRGESGDRWDGERWRLYHGPLARRFYGVPEDYAEPFLVVDTWKTISGMFNGSIEVGGTHVYLADGRNFNARFAGLHGSMSMHTILAMEAVDKFCAKLFLSGKNRPQ